MISDTKAIEEPTMKSKCIAAAALMSLFSAGIVRADVKLPAIFGDHMVLQRGQKVPVWGTADAGEQVNVSIGDTKATATAGADGKWQLSLDSLKASDQPTDVTVTGKNTITIKDVLVGDVWVASGQSNMEFGMNGAHNASVEIPKADHPTIRLFIVQKKTALEPQADCVGKWDVCSPTTVGRFSAVGYFFARDIAESQKVPVGMIGTYWGGTPAQSWTSIEALAEHPETKTFADSFNKLREDLPTLKEKYEKELLPAYETAHKKWQEEFGEEFTKATKQWMEDTNKAKAEGKAPTSRPVPPQPEPRKPTVPGENASIPSVLTNGMIAPIIPFAIKGAIWYQANLTRDRPCSIARCFRR